MTKSSLAHIEQTSVAALERELESPTIPPSALEKAKQKGLKRVAGFVVLDEAALADAREETLRYHTGRIKQYHAERDVLRGELAKRSITPKAILPTKTWTKICRESGLIRIAPDDNGRVNISDRALDQLAMSMGQAAAVLWGIHLFIAAAASLVAYEFIGEIGKAFVVGLLAGSVSAVISVIAAMISNDGYDTRLRTRLIRRIVGLRISLLRFERWEKVLARFFPGGEEPGSSRMMGTVVLPQPPEDFRATLLKAHGMAIKIAAEPAAIGFLEHPVDILKRKVMESIDILNQEHIQRARAQWEPIAYVEHGLATAIIDQFGDFVIEKQAVEKAMTTDFVP